MDTHPVRDEGAILPLTLVISVVLSMVVMSVASFTTVGLRYGKVVESRADRLAAADGGMRYAVGRLSAGAARLCATGGSDTIVAPSLNGADVEVTCGVVGPGFDYTNGWAMILTGEGIPHTTDSMCTGALDGDPCALLKTAAGVSTDKLIGGPVYMARPSFDLKAPIEFRRAQLLYTSSNCSAAPAIPTTSSSTSHRWVSPVLPSPGRVNLTSGRRRTRRPGCSMSRTSGSCRRT
jgi:hypothetical protein